MSFKVKQFQPVLEHRQRRGRRNIAWQAVPWQSLLLAEIDEAADAADNDGIVNDQTRLADRLSWCVDQLFAPSSNRWHARPCRPCSEEGNAVKIGNIPGGGGGLSDSDNVVFAACRN